MVQFMLMGETDTDGDATRKMEERNEEGRQETSFHITCSHSKW